MKNFLLQLFFLLFVNNALLCMEKNNQELKIFKNLRCLICQGQSVADSNSDFAQTIKLVVKDKLKDGKSETEIYDFLVSKYGEWIVYKPQMNKTNFILWASPYLILISGLILFFYLMRKSIKIKVFLEVYIS